MSRLVLILAIIILVWLTLRWFMRTPPQQVTQTLKRSLLWVVALILIALALTGRLHWLFAAGAALLPFAQRIFSLLRFLPVAKTLYGQYQARKSYQAPKAGQTSTVETRFLRMNLDHDSGEMDGEVLEGEFEDRLLGQLTLDELLKLRMECQHNDSESTLLLEAYLDREHSQWREQTNEQSHKREAPQSSESMTADEAREILGVDKNASEQEIIQAHRRLMHKLHPDKGGSDYLASKINLAKEFLLGKK